MDIRYSCNQRDFKRYTTQETREMAEPTLPVLYMEVEDTLVNPMYGYADEMEEQYIRSFEKNLA